MAPEPIRRDPETVKPGQRRPVLIGVVMLCAVAAFWILGPPRLPGDPQTDPTADPEASPEVSTPAPGEAGGHADGTGDARNAPPPRAPTVPAAAARDGVLRLLVLGDRQASAWAEHARAILEQRLTAATGPWRDARVELTLRSGPLWTAADALHHLQSGGWEADAPELIVVAVGWEDGGPGRALPAARSAVHGADTWLEELAVTPAVRHSERGRFYLNPNEGLPALSPLQHLEFLDTIGLEGAERGAAVIYLEQPVRHEVQDRRLFASTGMRPQPWISTAFGLESQPDPLTLFQEQDPVLLTADGGVLVGRFVGLGLVQVVLGS